MHYFLKTQCSLFDGIDDKGPISFQIFDSTRQNGLNFKL